MTIIIACFTAAISTTAFLTLWFWVVCRELRAKKDTVNSSWSQLSSCRKRYLLARGCPGEDEALGILNRSRDIYRQSVLLYNQALEKPWNRIPGFLMGFSWIPEEEL